MSSPTTPKKAGDGVNEIIETLAQWGYPLRIRDSTWSPSSRNKETNSGQVAEHCVARIKYLYFKDRVALNQLVSEAGAHASEVTRWTWKPRQEPGTLPQGEAIARELLQYLLRCLQGETFIVKGRLELAGESHVPVLTSGTLTSPREPSGFQQPVGTDDSVTLITQMARKSTSSEKPLSQTKESAQQTLSQYMEPFVSSHDTVPHEQISIEPKPDDVVLRFRRASLPTVERQLRSLKVSDTTPSFSKDSSKNLSDEHFETLFSQPTSIPLGAGIESPMPHGRVITTRVLEDDKEVFKTPPTTASLSFEDHLTHRLAHLSTQDLEGDLSTDCSFSKIHDIVPLTRISTSTKRRSSKSQDQQDCLNPSKIEVTEHGSPKRVRVHSYVPLIHAASRLQTPKPCGQSIVQALNLEPPPIAGINRSFDSESCFSTSISSLKSGYTTATTSFDSSEMGVSMANSDQGCNVEDSTPEQTAYQSRKGNIDDHGLSKFSPLVSRAFVPTPKAQEHCEDGRCVPGKACADDRIAFSKSVSSATTIDFSQYLDERLSSNGPFSQGIPDAFRCLSLRDRHDLTRVASTCSIPWRDLIPSAHDLVPEGLSLRPWLLGHPRLQGKMLGLEPPSAAWTDAGRQFQDVTISGKLTYNRGLEGPMLNFILNPLKKELSHRFARRFGNDRFLVMTLPGLTKRYMPSHLCKDDKLVRERLVEWLSTNEHQIMGRTWRAFSVKSVQASKSTKQGSDKDLNEPSYQIYLFAERGCDMKPHTGQLPSKHERPDQHSEMTVEELLEWHLPRQRNPDITYLKAFQRYHLAMSKTYGTISFRPQEIIRCDDIIPSSHLPSRLNVERSERIKKGGHAPPPEPVMNDGCARISRAAAYNIQHKLGLDHLPCAFQGRIAGAKGMWMVDFTNEQLQCSDRNWWIEISQSQCKFESHEIDNSSPDLDRVTFEVLTWSKPLLPATLNTQLIPILMSHKATNNCMKLALETLLEEDLIFKMEELKAAMEDPLLLRKWNQEHNVISQERAKVEGIEMLGALPARLWEQINFFLEHGFHPKRCRFFLELMRKTVIAYKDRLESNMSIVIGRSTYALILADPSGSLGPGEVHLSFSKMFRDPRSDFEDNMLCDIEVLVGRIPAFCAWDIQKVRAVEKAQLRQYKDVIIFSTKGNVPLASVLSGGDYDGDRAWVCWDPRLVDTFQGTGPPAVCPGIKIFGIEKDSTKLRHIPSYTEFLRRSFDFNMQPNLLGLCTVFHETICYHKNSIVFPGATTLATLLGLLVDKAKQGYIFTDQTWKAFLSRTNDLKDPRQSKPAYKNKDAKPTQHIIDHLLFKVAKSIIETTFIKFWKGYENVPTYDEDLIRPWKEAERGATTDPEIGKVLVRLKKDIDGVFAFWRDHQRSNSGSSPNDIPFSTLVESCSEIYKRILPAESTHSLVSYWIEGANIKAINEWTKLRASCTFSMYHKRGDFVWWVAAEDLGEIKATRDGNCHSVINALYMAYKLDSGYVRKMQSKRLLPAESVQYEEEDVLLDE
ncbi:MAG: hypothetical protein M1827_000230 [Pycnora praestabilis]|nr:MAG: hypothetical protein M1827_000230 [Pycnora praestabilis]